MHKTLLEAGFVTIDLGSAFNPTSEKTAAEPNAESSSSEQTVTRPAKATKAPKEKTSNKAANILPEKANWAAWKNELDTRLKQNKEKSPAKQQTNFEIESKFFEDFFNSHWSDSTVNLLALDDPFKKALKVLGLDPSKNPLLAFVTQKYVRDNLLGELLNASTFKAIYNAVANKAVADSEFLKENDYNLIYCPDLYRRSPAEIEAYLTIQKGILRVDASTYSRDDQIKNKRVFLRLEDAEVTAELDTDKRIEKIKNYSIEKIYNLHMNSTSIKLNDIKIAQKISGLKLASKADKTHINSKGQTNLAGKLTKPSQIFAAIQFLSVNTASKNAIRALSNKAFETLNRDQITQATAWLASQEIMPKGELSAADADNLTDVLLSKLQQLLK